MDPEVEKAIKEYAYWFHQNQLALFKGHILSDTDIDLEVEAWRKLERLLSKE